MPAPCPRPDLLPPARSRLCARDLAGYYAALAVHPHHNYYMGRAETDLSAWTEYFIETLARTFEAVAVEARRLVQAGVKTEPDFLRRLDRGARAYGLSAQYRHYMDGLSAMAEDRKGTFSTSTPLETA